MAKEEKILADILTEEIALYERFLTLKESERDALLEFRVKDLEEVIASQDELAGRAMELESARCRAVRDLAPADERRQGEPALSEVMEWLDPGSREEILALGTRLSEACLRLAERQDANARLIQSSAGYLHDLVETLLRRHQPEGVAYRAGGVRSRAAEPMPSLLDRTL